MEQERITKALREFEKNGFKTRYFTSGTEAAEWLDDQVNGTMSVGWGGSKTLRQLGLLERFAAKGADVCDLAQPDGKRRALDADVFFCSANALIEKGWIFNCDGRGNRVAAMIFGPPRVYIIAGLNKLVPDEQEAELRLRKIAPIICRSSGRDTPCAKTGECADCQSADRSCRIYVTMKRPPRTVDMTVVLINEELGV